MAQQPYKVCFNCFFNTQMNKVRGKNQTKGIYNRCSGLLLAYNTNIHILKFKILPED